MTPSGKHDGALGSCSRCANDKRHTTADEANTMTTMGTKPDERAVRKRSAYARLAVTAEDVGSGDVET